MGKRSESLGIVISTQAANDQHPLSQLIDDAALGEDDGVYLQLACAPAYQGRSETRSAAEAFPPLDQLASLCASHHNAKTRAEQRGEDYMRKGCDIFGRPNDPDHPWNKGA